MSVTIERFLDPWEAHVVKARLSAEGIDATLSNDQLANEWPIAFAVGGAALLVAEEDASRARAILAAYRRGDYAHDLDDAPPPGDDSGILEA